jgi:hypothetical protein
MTPRPQTFVEHDILSLDAKRGIRYQSFEDFWQKRMEPMQFIPAEATGALGACREILKTRAKEQWILWTASQVPPDHPSWDSRQIADGCGGSPQAGGAQVRPPHEAGGTQLYGDAP